MIGGIVVRYIYECEFRESPECSMCMLSGSKGLNIDGETVMVCYGLGNRPKCPEEGCRKDCPLKPLDDQD